MSALNDPIVAMGALVIAGALGILVGSWWKTLARRRRRRQARNVWIKYPAAERTRALAWMEPQPEPEPKLKVVAKEEEKAA